MAKSETEISEEAILLAANAIEKSASEGAFKKLSGDDAATAIAMALRIIGVGDWRKNP